MIAKRNDYSTPVSAPEQELWRKLPLETLWTIWHLHRGGVEPQRIASLVTPKQHPNTIRSIAERFDELARLPLPVCGKVRCLQHGGLLTAVPCMTCDWKTEHFSVPAWERTA